MDASLEEVRPGLTILVDECQARVKRGWCVLRPGVQRVHAADSTKLIRLWWQVGTGNDTGSRNSHESCNLSPIPEPTGVVVHISNPSTSVVRWAVETAESPGNSSQLAWNSQCRSRNKRAPVSTRWKERTDLHMHT